jgi:hypothetical protein
LTVVYALAPTIFNVLIEPIKNAFALSDTAMGLLAGFGFVLFCSLLSAAVTTTVGALLFIRAARSIRGDIRRATWPAGAPGPSCCFC